MNVRPSLVPHLQATELIQPRQRPLDHPAIAPQPLTGIDAAAGDAWDDAPPAHRSPTGTRIIALVRMQLSWPLAGTAMPLANRRQGLQQPLQYLGIRHIGCGVADYEWDAVSFDHNRALRARFAAIRRIRAGGFAPRGAGPLAESRAARDQSIWSTCPKRFKSRRWSWSHTPAACQSRSRRQQVISLPQPISWGSISQGMPVLSTKRMPVRAAWLLMCGRPPLGLAGSGGRIGSITAHSSSLINGFAIPRLYQISGFC